MDIDDARRLVRDHPDVAEAVVTLIQHAERSEEERLRIEDDERISDSRFARGEVCPPHDPDRGDAEVVAVAPPRRQWMVSRAS